MRAMGSSQPGFKSIAAVEIAPAVLGAGQVRVQVVASAINPADLLVQDRAFFGRILHATTPPLVPGYDFSGTVLELGAGVTDLAVGDDVFGHLAYTSANNQGAFSENVVVDASTVARKPAGLEHGQAACAATVGLTAFQFLRDLGRLSKGQKLLVLGGAGGVGSCAVGIGKRLGAHVTAVCSGYAVDYVRKLGADEVIDRAQKDALLPGPAYDVIFDTTATYAYLRAAKVLTPAGAFVTTQPSPSFLVGKAATLFSSRRCLFGSVQSRRADLEQLAAWLGDGMLVPVAERFPARAAVAAFERFTSGRLLGRVVVDVKDGF